jgi:hypothetical protein
MCTKTFFLTTFALFDGQKAISGVGTFGLVATSDREPKLEFSIFRCGRLLPRARPGTQSCSYYIVQKGSFKRVQGRKGHFGGCVQESSYLTYAGNLAYPVCR